MGDMLVLLAGHQTCNSQVTGLSPGFRQPPRRGLRQATYCYQAVYFGTDPKAMMLFSWQGNRGPDGK